MLCACFCVAEEAGKEAHNTKAGVFGITDAGIRKDL